VRDSGRSFGRFFGRFSRVTRLLFNVYKAHETHYLILLNAISNNFLRGGASIRGPPCSFQGPLYIYIYVYIYI